uniref:G-protein coupled receptors family 3 profile domain-containing protein n=1 Tax=Anabas testudineus TaxID=64144 RepID=A0A7N6BCD2_ANATE
IKIYLFLNLMLFIIICSVLSKFNIPSWFKQGDIMIGAIFPVSLKETISISTYERDSSVILQPISNTKTLGRFDLRSFRWTHVMIFSIEEINKDPVLLPNVSLGYRILSSCASPTSALRAALALVSGLEEISSTSPCAPAISALIGESGSSQSIPVAGTFGSFQLPIVSYFSSCACLTDRVKYPTFFRTVSSDYFQAKALAALINHFGWQWIGVIQSDNDYGRSGIMTFTEEVKKFGVCIAFVGKILRTYPMDKILNVVKIIKQSTVKVILAFTTEGDFYPLMTEIVKQNITGIQWLAAYGWITAARPSTPEIFQAFGGTLGFVGQKVSIPDLKPFLTSISPYKDPSAAFVRNFWETVVGCRPVLPGEHIDTETTIKICTGNETLMNSEDVFFNVTELRDAYNVYKAVYAIAHALHELLFCEKCNNAKQENTQFPTSLKLNKCFRNQFGENIFFDKNGDPPAYYDLINWQLVNGQVQHVTLGHFASVTNSAYELNIQENDIVWRTGKTVPISLCSNVCPVGTRKAQIKGKPTCCFDCIQCADGTIANSTGRSRSKISNPYQTSTVQSFTLFCGEPMGIAVTVVSLLGASLSLATMMIFIHYRETPVIKASNSELSCFLLFSLLLCFLCPLTFIGRPTVWTCMLRHTAFAVTFALCISSVLGKTIVVVTAFKATYPGNKAARKFGLAQQRIIVCSCTVMQILICILWLKLNPPFPDMVFRYSNKKIVLECNPGSEVAFYAVLGYIGLLAVICLVLAFLARKLPDNFNEAKFITFSMLIFCSVWITFIPAYISSPGKFTVAVETFAILSSAFGLLICIFAPKCYIIMIKPEKNTKKHVMGKI